MNKYQAAFLAEYTNGILDKYPDVDEVLQAHHIPKVHARKITKAFDMIFQVNQSCIPNKPGPKQKQQ